MKFVTEENGKNPQKNYPDSDSSTMKSTLGERVANSRPLRWEASEQPLAPLNRRIDLNLWEVEAVEPLYTAI